MGLKWDDRCLIRNRKGEDIETERRKALEDRGGDGKDAARSQGMSRVWQPPRRDKTSMEGILPQSFQNESTLQIFLFWTPDSRTVR